MNKEKHFLEAINAGEPNADLIYADWLEEQGRPEAGEVRDPIIVVLQKWSRFYSRSGHWSHPRSRSHSWHFASGSPLSCSWLRLCSHSLSCSWLRLYSCSRSHSYSV